MPLCGATRRLGNQANHHYAYLVVVLLISLLYVLACYLSYVPYLGMIPTY